MKNLFFLFILHSVFFTSANAQWWVSGGNLLWPYGDVTIKSNLNVDGTVNGAKYYNFLFTHAGDTNDPTITDLFNNIGTNSSWVRVSTGLYRTNFTDITFNNSKVFNTRSVALDNTDRQVNFLTYTNDSDLFLQINNFGDFTFYDPNIDRLPISLIYYP